MKILFTSILILLSLGSFAQKNKGRSSTRPAVRIDSMFVNLYTDSLKKGTYNYINIDGKLNNGRYIPLDSSDVSFSSSDGKFHGNSLWINPDFEKEKVRITVVLKSDRDQKKTFDVYIKKNPDPELENNSR